MNNQDSNFNNMGQNVNSLNQTTMGNPISPTPVQMPVSQPVNPAPAQMPVSQPMNPAPAQMPANQPMNPSPAQMPANQPMNSSPVQMPAQPNGMNTVNLNYNYQPEKQKKSIIPIILIVIIIILGGVAAFLYFGKNKNNNEVTNTNTIPQINKTEDTKETEVSTLEETPNSIEEENKVDETIPTEVTTSDSTIPSSIFEANVNGVLIKFPTNKEGFNGTGWSWDPKYANKDLQTGYTSSGGRIGEYPGGVVVDVINNSGETKKIQDCIIDDGTFYNPKDGSAKVIFIGGLNYNSTKSEVKSKMKELGFKNLKEIPTESSVYYRYYLNDNTANFRDYIEFYFFKDKINYISIYTSGN